MDFSIEEKPFSTNKKTSFFPGCAILSPGLHGNRRIQAKKDDEMKTKCSTALPHPIHLDIAHKSAVSRWQGNRQRLIELELGRTGSKQFCQAQSSRLTDCLTALIEPCDMVNLRLARNGKSSKHETRTSFARTFVVLFDGSQPLVLWSKFVLLLLFTRLDRICWSFS